MLHNVVSTMSGCSTFRPESSILSWRSKGYWYWYECNVIFRSRESAEKFSTVRCSQQYCTVLYSYVVLTPQRLKSPGAINVRDKVLLQWTAPDTLHHTTRVMFSQTHNTLTPPACTTQTCSGHAIMFSRMPMYPSSAPQW
jgi:hypothetical protein